MPLLPINDPSTPSVLRDAASAGTPIAAGRTRKLLRTERLMAAVIDIDNGPWTAPDPYHAHPHEQLSYVAAGELLLLVEGQDPQHLRAGDLFAVPGNVPHSIQLLSPRVRLVDVFHPIREDFL
jgi:quercetin dioxygenase-like cupin family protein